MLKYYKKGKQKVTIFLYNGTSIIRLIQHDRNKGITMFGPSMKEALEVAVRVIQFFEQKDEEKKKKEESNKQNILPERDSNIASYIVIGLACVAIFGVLSYLSIYKIYEITFAHLCLAAICGFCLAIQMILLMIGIARNKKFDKALKEQEHKMNIENKKVIEEMNKLKEITNNE